MQYYVALFTAGGEIAAADYARQLVTVGIIYGRTANTTHASWAPETDWGTAISMGLYVSASGGDPAYEAQLTQSVDMLAGVIRRIARGRIVFPEGLLDTALADEILADQPELGVMLPAVELAELIFPPPSGPRIVQWARRAV